MVKSKDENNLNKESKLIRNSTAEFLIFQLDNKEQGIEVLYKDETLWITQKTMADNQRINLDLGWFRVTH